MTEKQRSRRLFSAVRDTMTPQERAAADAAILTHLVNSALYRDAELLLTYVSIRSEADTRSIIAHALAHDKRVAVPRCEGTQMTFHLIPALSALQPGAFGVPEPDPAACPPIDPPAGTLCLIPGLSFDRLGGRLGYGAGFYDRYLAAHPVTRLGLCAERCVAAAVPLEATDQRMHLLLTERGFTAFDFA